MIHRRRVALVPRLSGCAPISCWSKTAHHRKQTRRAGLAAQGGLRNETCPPRRLARALRTAPLCDIVQPTWVKVRRVMRHLLLVVGLVWPIGFASAQTFGEITGGKVRDQSGAAASNARRERKSIGAPSRAKMVPYLLRSRRRKERLKVRRVVAVAPRRCRCDRFREVYGRSESVSRPLAGP